MTYTTVSVILAGFAVYFVGLLVVYLYLTKEDDDGRD